MPISGARSKLQIKSISSPLKLLTKFTCVIASVTVDANTIAKIEGNMNNNGNLRKQR